MAADHPLAHHFHTIRSLIRRKHQCDFPELARKVDELEAEVQALYRRPCHCGQTDGAPATVTVHLFTSEGNLFMSETTFAPGATVYATAVVDNAEGVALTDAGTWTTTAGTISPDPSNPEAATVVGLPLGDFTVTYTASNGVSNSVSGTVTDSTPATVSVSLSSTAPAAPSA